MGYEAERRCSQCGAVRVIPKAESEGVPPCPNDGCGSTAVTTEVTVTDEVGVHDRVRGNVKRPTTPSRRAAVEFVAGSEYYRAGDRWHRVERIFDRAQNWYSELIYDVETGALVRRCEEPLDRHRGHGSARRSGGE